MNSKFAYNGKQKKKRAFWGYQTEVLHFSQQYLNLHSYINNIRSPCFFIVFKCKNMFIHNLWEPFLQKILYEQNTKKNYNSSLCQTKSIHMMYINFKKHNTGNVNIDSLKYFQWHSYNLN